MSDRRDFDFDDDIFDDEPGGTSAFDDDPALGGSFDEDMPEIDAEPEQRTNRTFVILAVAMILLFIIGIGVILAIATRPVGPTDAELTVTAIVGENQAVGTLAAQTATQDVINLQLTQTALAATATPSDTASPTDTATSTPPPPTGTPDLTATAAFLLLNGTEQALALTQTALAQPTVTPTPLPTDPISIRNLFATEIAFATQAGAFNAGVLATQQSLATAIAGDAADQAVLEGIIAEQQETLNAVLFAATPAAAAVGGVDVGLATIAALDPNLLVLVIQATAQAQEPQGIVSTAAAAATSLAQQQAELLTSQAPDAPERVQATVIALSTDIPALATSVAGATQGAIAARATLIQLSEATPTQAAPDLVDLRAFFATEVAFATQAGAFDAGVIGTQQIFATQLAAGGADEAVGGALLFEQEELRATVQANQPPAITAIAQIDTGLATFAALDPALSGAVAQATTVAQPTQQFVQDAQAQATTFAQDQEAILAGQPTDNPAVIEATQIALTTNIPGVATSQGVATQGALAARAALIDQALLGPQPTATIPNVLDIVNQTATAIAGAFLTATAQAQPQVTATLGTPALVTPGFTPIVVPTALPDTGLFDDVTGGGNLGWLVLGIIGLVGVIVVARQLRSRK